MSYSEINTREHMIAVGMRAGEFPSSSILNYAKTFCDNYAKLVIVRKIATAVDKKTEGTFILAQESYPMVPVPGGWERDYPLFGIMEMLNREDYSEKHRMDSFSRRSFPDTLPEDFNKSNAIDYDGYMLNGEIHKKLYYSDLNAIQKRFKSSRYKDSRRIDDDDVVRTTFAVSGENDTPLYRFLMEYCFHANTDTFFSSLYRHSRPVVYQTYGDNLDLVYDYTGISSIKLTKLTYNCPPVFDFFGLPGAMRDLMGIPQDIEREAREKEKHEWEREENERRREENERKREEHQWKKEEHEATMMVKRAQLRNCEAAGMWIRNEEYKILSADSADIANRARRCEEQIIKSQSVLNMKYGIELQDGSHIDRKI